MGPSVTAALELAVTEDEEDIHDREDKEKCLDNVLS